MKNVRLHKQAEHTPVGLVDTETGEVLLKSFSPRQAQLAGFVQKRDDSTYEQKKQKKEAEAYAQLNNGDDDEYSSDSPDDSTDGGDSGSPVDGEPPKLAKKSRNRQGPVVGRVPIIQITIPVELYFLYVLTQSRYDGFADSPEAFTEWLSYCVFKLHTLFPEVFGLQDFLLKTAESRGIKIGAKN